MRRIHCALLATVASLSFASIASAADMPAKAPVYKAAPVVMYNWTGWYGGVNGGYGWGSATDPGITFSDTSGTGYAAYIAAGGFPTPSLNPKGAFGGAQIGYNLQQSNWVWGLEADIQGASIKASSTQTVTPPLAVTGTSSVEHKLNWFGTVRGRLGIAQNNWLFYGTGGLIYGGVHSSLTQDSSAANTYIATDSHTKTKAGWTLGAGTEMGWGKWSAKLEYLYYDMGRDTVTVRGVGIFTGIVYSASQKTAGHLARVGLNYRF